VVSTQGSTNYADRGDGRGVNRVMKPASEGDRRMVDARRSALTSAWSWRALKGCWRA